MTWPEAVDEALSFGWIDGVRKRIDSISYTIRFTPRNPKSIRKELIDLGRMRPGGVSKPSRSLLTKDQPFSYEQRKTAELGDVYEQRFRANKMAWKFFQAQPPGIRGLPRSG